MLSNATDFSCYLELRVWRSDLHLHVSSRKEQEDKTKSGKTACRLKLKILIIEYRKIGSVAEIKLAENGTYIIADGSFREEELVRDFFV